MATNVTPILLSSSAIKKLILPNSLKKITKNGKIRIGASSDYKGTIVFHEGAKIFDIKMVSANPIKMAIFMKISRYTQLQMKHP